MRLHVRVPATTVLAVWMLSTIGWAQVPSPPQGMKKLLFLTHAALYKHSSLEPAEAAVTGWGKTAGFEVTTLQGYKQDSRNLDFSMLTPEYLNSFDGLMLMTNGNLPLTPAQRQSIVDFVKNGKALVGVHCATLTLYDYPEFGDVLGGYYLRSLVPTDMIAEGEIGVLKIEDSNHPATRMLGPSWPLNEEFYEFGHAVWDANKPTENVSAVGRLHILMPFSRDRVHVLLSLDTDKTDLSDLPNVPRGDYPQAWTRTFGRGRAFYTALGHRTTSGRTTPSSGRTSAAASGGRWDWRTEVPEKCGARLLKCGARLQPCGPGGVRDPDGRSCSTRHRGHGLRAARTDHRSSVANLTSLPVPGFHHLHLNSINPEAGDRFLYATISVNVEGDLRRTAGAEVADRRLVLFTTVDTPPRTQPQTAFWHFGWVVTDVHKSAEVFKQHGVTLLPSTPKRRCHGRHQRRHLAW